MKATWDEINNLIVKAQVALASREDEHDRAPNQHLRDLLADAEWVARQQIEIADAEWVARQQNDIIPTDLVLLPSWGDLNEADREMIFLARWYEDDNGYMLASAQEIDFLSEDAIEDATACGLTLPVVKINECLKRGNETDGFYHA